jgi:two-component system cell cycle sensor histidine kinase/response regulator CckA
VLEELRNTRDLLDHVLAEAPVGIGVVTREGKLLRLNRVAREMVEAWGKVEDDRLLSLGGMDLEALFQTRRGEIRPTREVVLEYHLHRLGGEQNLWILMLQDRTEERRLFQELRRSERMAALGQMSAGITHDLNNWLTAVIGYTELLEPFLKDPEAREYHQEILRQARRMVDLVGKIMDFVRARPRQVSVINVCDELKRNLEVYRKMLTPRIKLSLVLPEKVETCRAEVDPVALHQIMLNLLANARDAMEGAGKVDIRVSFEHRPSRPGQPERDWVCVKVEDTGKGIPPEHLDRIFDPYFTTKPFQRGTGLGLAQVYGLVRNTGGWVEVESEVGKGTTFILYFPRVVEETAKTSAGESHLEGSRKKPYNTSESQTSEQDDRP